MLLKTSEKLALFAAWSRWWRLAGMWIVGLLVMLRYIHSIDMIISVDNRNTWFRILMRARLWGISLYLVIRWYNDWFLLLQHTNTIYIEINFVNVLTVCIRILFPSGKYKTIFINLYSIYDTNKDASLILKSSFLILWVMVSEEEYWKKPGTEQWQSGLVQGGSSCMPITHEDEWRAEVL